MSIFPINFKLAAKAYRLSLQGLKGKAIGASLKVSTDEANILSSCGRTQKLVDAHRLTDGELALIRALADIERERLINGEVSSPKSKFVSWRCRKSSGWAAATVAKRLGAYRKGEDIRYRGTGLDMVHASANGHIWLTASGWALVHALESSK